MSNSIKDVEKAQSRQLDSLKRRNAREVGAIEKAHQNYTAEISKAHKTDIIDLQDQNNRSLNLENEKKEKLLIEMRSHLQRTQSLTDKELKSLKENASNEKVQTQQKLGIDKEMITAQSEMQLAEINHRMQQVTHNASEEGRNNIQKMNQTMSDQYSQSEGQFQKKINDQNNEFTVKYQKEGLTYKKIKDDQDNQFKKERMATNNRQQVDMAKLTEGHNEHIEKRDHEFRKGLKEQDVFFENKYEVNLQGHNENLQGLDDRHGKVLQKMKEVLSTKLSQSVNRSDDPFYQFSELKSTMEQRPDFVEIKVEVPDHSKQDLQLTTNGKEAIVTFNRRYSENNQSEMGVLQKLNKVETFTTRMKAEYALDPKSVKGRHENGIMTYTIKKA